MKSQKFAGTEFEEKIRLSSTPKEAKKLGNNKSFPLRKDWEIVIYLLFIFILIK